VLHPLQCLGAPRIARELLRGSAARIEGDPAARALARRLARQLGLVVLPVRPSRRVAYHAGASIVANDLVALLAIGIDAFRAAGVGERQARAALAALARGVLAHAARRGLAAAFTGPVARDDAGTLERQLAVLATEDAQAHRLLSLRLARAAVRLGAARPARVLALLDALARPRGSRYSLRPRGPRT
jgi:predicted short-subunit dehydrogenase-like oxidoreductase (DUF2520 family)